MVVDIFIILVEGYLWWQMSYKQFMLTLRLPTNSIHIPV